MILLGEPISQFQFSMKANIFYLAELELLIDLLDVVEIVEIQILDWSLEEKYLDVAFPNFSPQFQLQLRAVFAELLCLRTAESTFRSRIFWKFSLSLKECTTFWSPSLFLFTLLKMVETTDSLSTLAPVACVLARLSTNSVRYFQGLAPEDLQKRWELC